MAVVLVVHSGTFVVAQECLDDGKTCDMHERCGAWQTEGECLLNRSYMKKHCPAACRDEWKQEQERNLQKQQQKKPSTPTVSPKSKVCEDRHERCHLWAQVGECEENRDVMRKHCAKSCGLCATGAQQRKVAAKKPIEDENDDEEDEDFDGEFDQDSEDDYYNSDDYDDDDVDEGSNAPACEDKDELCSFWAQSGECDKNERYMSINCAVSCGTCDQVRRMTITTKSKYSLTQYETDLIRQTEQFGVAQAAEGTQIKETIQKIQESVSYMNDEKTQALPRSILDVCENRNKLCAFWAVLGECEKNQAYMTTNCAPSCSSCHMIDIKTRCPPLDDAEPALRPGDLQRMFERIVREAPGNRTLTPDEKKALVDSNTTEYTVVVHSGPGTPAPTDVSIATDKSLLPWVITFENFLTDDECDELIRLGYKYGYKRSEDVGARKFDGTHDSVKSERRTSENAWCSDFHGCRGEVVPTNVHNRMSRVMGIPANNSEDLQMLRYEKGQFYRTHHDFIPHQVERQCGPRILTFFLYLSDVEAGGGTNFPQLDLTVMPKKGRALLWPSVLNASPTQKDGRMMHQALDVEEGTKFAANGWIHMYDYVTPQAKGCN